VHGGVGQVEAGGQVAETKAAGRLEGEQDANGSVDALNQWAVFLEEALDGTLSRE
jgi:hypothetical protein